MTTLAFDTCFGACSVAITWRDGRQAHGAFRFERLARGHAERLMPMIADAMSEAPFGYDAIERVFVTDGPGTFTGQRVGIAAARALALATGADVHVLSSLRVMAFTARASLAQCEVGAAIAVAVDARRGEIYVQAFTGDELSPLSAPQLMSPMDAAASLGAGSLTVVGSGGEPLAEACRSIGFDARALLATLEPDVQHIPHDLSLSPVKAPRPLYLRPPDAKPQVVASLMRMQ